MNRVVGLETEYGALVHDAELSTEAWPARVKNYIFRQARAGALDLHYRDYEEPPGNGGFLLNGGRLYLDMGHIELSPPSSLRTSPISPLKNTSHKLRANVWLSLISCS